MNTSTFTENPSAGSGAAEIREQRVAREKLLIAKAEADIAAGLYYEFDELEMWFDRLEIDRNAILPAPPVRTS